MAIPPSKIDWTSDLAKSFNADGEENSGDNDNENQYDAVINDVDDSVDDEDSDLAVYLYTISFEAVSSKAQSNLYIVIMEIGSLLDCFVRQ